MMKDELEFNRQNREKTEKLMDESSTKKDGYWDRDNLFVRFILSFLFLVIVGGTLYYLLSYFAS